MEKCIKAICQHYGCNPEDVKTFEDEWCYKTKENELIVGTEEMLTEQLKKSYINNDAYEDEFWNEIQEGKEIPTLEEWQEIRIKSSEEEENKWGFWFSWDNIEQYEEIVDGETIYICVWS